VKDPLADHVRVLLDNPFDAGAERVTAAIAALSRRGAAESLLRSALDRGGEAADRALLAVAHAQASAAPGKTPQLAAAEAVPAAAMRALRHPRAAYVVVGAAAGRAARALEALRGTSPAMSAVRRAAWAACFGDSLVHALELASVIGDHDVVILGETGTGKEVLANAIQEGCFGPKDGSPAPRASFNAAAVPETLVAAELFGHVKGAFTGANEARLGRIRSAHAGSLFLDEVGDLGPSTQVKLLRVIETDEVSPLGSDKTYPASCRYVAATHKDLGAMVAAGVFRRDLYERLAGTVIRLPPLRDRPEDIADIGRTFVDRYLPQAALGTTRRRVDRWLESDEAKRHRWPGNVRELQNALRNLMLGLDPGVIRDRAEPAAERDEELPTALRDGTASLDEAVDWYVRRVLSRMDNNLARTARTLGVDRNTVRRRLRPG
jgi:DNA-binding NtrC family response regulator